LYPYALTIFILSACYLVYRRAYINKIVVMAIALGLLTMAMSLTSRRFIPLFAVSEALTMSLVLSTLLSQIVNRAPRGVLPSAALAFALLLIWPYPKSASSFQYLTAEDEFPVEMCDFIEANNLKGNIFAYYNWGGYLHLRTGGRMKVFIDGRADTVLRRSDSPTVQRRSRSQGRLAERYRVLWCRFYFVATRSEGKSFGGACASGSMATSLRRCCIRIAGTFRQFAV
jgi:hypothetical protein